MGFAWANTDYRLSERMGVFSPGTEKRGSLKRAWGLFLSPILTSCVCELQIPSCGLLS